MQYTDPIKTLQPCSQACSRDIASMYISYMYIIEGPSSYTRLTPISQRVLKIEHWQMQYMHAQYNSNISNVMVIRFCCLC